MELNKDQKEKIINMGAFNYDASRIASVIEVEQIIVEKELKNTDSELCKLLKKGADLSDYVIDLKLFNLAQSGDIKALEKLEYRKKTRK